jgi:hypothetical protein
LLRSLQEIQPDFEKEAKAYAGLWSQGKKKDFVTLLISRLNEAASSALSGSSPAVRKKRVSHSIAACPACIFIQSKVIQVFNPSTI